MPNRVGTQVMRTVDAAVCKAAGATFNAIQFFNKCNPNPSFTPKWSDKPLLKYWEKTKPTLGWPRQTDSPGLTVSGPTSGNRSTRANAVDESSTMIDEPGSTIGSAAAAIAAFSARRSVRRYSEWDSNAEVGWAETPPRYFRTSPRRTSSSTSRCTVIRLTPVSSTSSDALAEPAART